MYIVRSFAIDAAEARYLLAAYTPAGVYAPDLDHRIQKLTRYLGQREYFLDSGRWNAEKWRQTDFIILKDPGPISDRIIELKEDEQRMATGTWWLMNLCMQLEALGLQFDRPLEAKADFGYVAPPIEPPTVVSISTPELVQRAVDAAIKKYQTSSKVTKEESQNAAQSSSERVCYPAGLFPMKHEYILTLRPEEPSKLIKLLKSEPGSTTHTMALELLGEELTQIFLNHHVLVPIQAEQPGLVRVNLHALKAMTIRIHAHRLRVDRNKKTGYPSLDSLLAQLDNLSNDYRKRQVKPPGCVKKAAVKVELPKVEAPAAVTTFVKPDLVVKHATVPSFNDHVLSEGMAWNMFLDIEIIERLLKILQENRKISMEESVAAFGTYLAEIFPKIGFFDTDAAGLQTVNSDVAMLTYIHPRAGSVMKYTQVTQVKPSTPLPMKKSLSKRLEDVLKKHAKKVTPTVV